jgi:glyoxylase-like metal-dependent hydrolase (beta-lactamase superfamily II)
MQSGGDMKIHGLNSMDLYVPEDTVRVLLLNAGKHPDIPEDTMKLFGFNPKLRWPSGEIRPGVFQPLTFWYVEGASKKIVVDTGANDEWIKVANEAFRKRGQGQVYVREDRHDVRKFLRAHGTTPEEIEFVVLTHLHLDHFLNTREFPNAKFIVQKEELPWGLTPPPYAEFHWKEFVPNLTSVLDRVVMIDGDIELCKGVDVLRVGGHTPGSQVLRVRTSNGVAILAGDFFYNYKNIEHAWPIGSFFRLDEWIVSCARLKAMADVIVPTHDLYFWEQFRSGTIE